MGFLRYNTKSCKPNDKGAIMLQISRNGYLHKGEWHKVSLKFFGYSLFAREKIIKGYKGGGHNWNFCHLQNLWQNHTPNPPKYPDYQPQCRVLWCANSTCQRYSCQWASRCKDSQPLQRARYKEYRHNHAHYIASAYHSSLSQRILWLAYRRRIPRTWSHQERVLPTNPATLAHALCV